MSKVQKNNDKAIVLIKKSNNLVESRYKFDIWETRFFLSILAQNIMYISRLERFFNASSHAALSLN